MWNSNFNRRNYSRLRVTQKGFKKYNQVTGNKHSAQTANSREYSRPLRVGRAELALGLTDPRAHQGSLSPVPSVLCPLCTGGLHTPADVITVCSLVQLSGPGDREISPRSTTSWENPKDFTPQRRA